MRSRSGPGSGPGDDGGTEELLELILEPYGSDHWLLPGETFMVRSVDTGGGRPWSGTAHAYEPFEVEQRPGSVTVHANGNLGYVTDLDGNEIDCAHRRPGGPGTG